MINRILILISVLCACGPVANAQAPPEFIIWGRVVSPEDYFSRQGGIEVRLETPARTFVNSTTTDDDGRFQFRDVGQGRFQLVINLEGFVLVDEPVFVASPGAKIGQGTPGSTTQPRVILYLRRGVTDNTLAATRREGSEKKSAEVGPSSVIDADIFKKYSPKAVREYNDGMADVRKEEIGKAITRFNKAIEIEPRFYEAHVELGRSKQRLGRIPEAESALQRARELEPNSAEPMVRLGGVLLDKARMLESSGKPDEAAGVYDTAAGLLDQAVRLDLGSVEGHYLLGSALFKTNELDDAELNLLQSINAPRPLEDARLMLANVYMKQRRYDEVIAQLEAYLSANPNTPQRKNIEGMLKTLQVQLKPAIKP